MKEGQGKFFIFYKTDVHYAKHDFGKHVFKMALTSEVPAQVWRTYKDLSPIEVDGQGYPAGGEIIEHIEIETDMENGACMIKAANVLFKKLNVGAPACAVVYNETAGLLVSYYTLTTVTNGGDYKIKIPKGELFYDEPK